ESTRSELRTPPGAWGPRCRYSYRPTAGPGEFRPARPGPIGRREGIPRRVGAWKVLHAAARAPFLSWASLVSFAQGPDLRKKPAVKPRGFAPVPVQLL